VFIVCAVLLLLPVCRVSWAGLELREGNASEARQLLREGLDAHPDFPGALLLLAKLERLEGQLDVAEAYARRAQKVSLLGVVGLLLWWTAGFA
jgi:Tfp pilus assembly protein PilF